MMLTALRQFKKTPGFSAAVVLTIALGIGANTAIFTLVRAVLLSSLPVKNPTLLYRLGSGTQAGINSGLASMGDFSLFSFELYRHLQQTTPEFEELAAMQSRPNTMNVRLGDEVAKSERTEYVSGNYFRTLGLNAMLGRVISSPDDEKAAQPVAVMSYAAWQSDYGRNPQVIGRPFNFQGHPVTVVGVAPAGFFGDRVSANPPAFWIPLSVEPTLEGGLSILQQSTINWLYLLGRVKPGTQTASLSTRLTVSLKNWLMTQPGYLSSGGASGIAQQRIDIIPGGGGIQQVQEQQKTGLYLLMGISGLVLLVACANVANLLIARGTTRRAEISIRIALGAERSRVIWQTLVESIVLACAGGLAGLVLASVAAKMILALAFPDSPQLTIQTAPSLSVFIFAFLLSLITGALCGIVPALIASNAQPVEALRGGNRTSQERSSLLRRSLIIFQSCLSLILLIGASLLTRTLVHLQKKDFGFNTNNRYVIQIDPVGAGYRVDNVRAFYQTLEERFAATPGIAAVGLGLYSPLEGTNWASSVNVGGRPAPAPGIDSSADWDRVNPGFFSAVGEGLVRGRVFTEEDTATTEKVAVVNEAFANKFLSGETPIGSSFGAETGQNDTYRIVGVVADANFVDATKKPRPMYFLPLTQGFAGISANFAAEESRGLFANAIVLSFKGVPQGIDTIVRRTIAGINPNLTVNRFQSLDYQVNGNFTQNRLIARLATLFGFLALVLAAVGLYAITSYQVARRTSEIGLRMALGATRSNVLYMVLRSAFVDVTIGVLIGIPIAFVSARSFASQLYGVQPYDPISLVLAVAALSIAAALAGLLPATKAAKTEPILALRIE